MGALLLFDILDNRFFRDGAYCFDVIGRIPQMTVPQRFFYPGILQEDLPGRNTLDHLDDIGRRHPRMRRSEHMHMILFPDLAMRDPEPLVLGHFVQDGLHVVCNLVCKRFSAILGAEDNVIVAIKNACSAMLDRVFRHADSIRIICRLVKGYSSLIEYRWSAFISPLKWRGFAPISPKEKSPAMRIMM